MTDKRSTTEDERPVPLTDAEDRLWRSVARALIVVPRTLDADLQRDSGMTMGEYLTLMILSESPDRQRRMSELSKFIGLSASRMTRLIDALAVAGFVGKNRDPVDGRGMVAMVTDAGVTRLEQAYPAHLASVRARVIEPLASLEPSELAAALEKLT